MTFTFSNNPIDKFSCWFENSILEPLSRYYYRHKKTHYQCAICGCIEAPYFTEEKYASITKDMGWHKLDSGKWNRWVCHHCADHGFAPSSPDVTNEYCSGWTWDEWQRFVKEVNRKLILAIKNKDPEYYEYWFDSGREQKLFGDEDEKEV